MNGFKGEIYKPNDWGNEKPVNISMYWRIEIMTHFSGLAITYESDRLPALSGLINCLERATGEKYYAGIWNFRFHEGLIWFVTRERAQGKVKNFKENAPAQLATSLPSWSWASTNNIIGYPHFPQFFRSHIEDWQVQWLPHVQCSSKSFDVGRIHLTGTLRDAEIGEDLQRMFVLYITYGAKCILKTGPVIVDLTPGGWYKMFLAELRGQQRLTDQEIKSPVSHVSWWPHRSVGKINDRNRHTCPTSHYF
jgi:hypothetical protein